VAVLALEEGKGRKKSSNQAGGTTECEVKARGRSLINMIIDKDSQKGVKSKSRDISTMEGSRRLENQRTIGFDGQVT
jgi:hypothetical protein